MSACSLPQISPTGQHWLYGEVTPAFWAGLLRHLLGNPDPNLGERLFFGVFLGVQKWKWGIRQGGPEGIWLGSTRASGRMGSVRETVLPGSASPKDRVDGQRHQQMTLAELGQLGA